VNGQPGQAEQQGEGPEGQGQGEAWGDATDNERLEAEGKVDQSKADLKQAGEKVKDALRK
jgi:uncharacterized protein YjbJ (UPF0337 family)